MESYAHKEIPEILQKEGNSECVDCGAQNPKWASLNNGIFICEKCVEIHRNLGSNISLIRSLLNDAWKDNEIKFLLKGGNNNFKKNLTEFNIDPKTASIDLKYKSKASHYYRRNLKNEVEKETNPKYVDVQMIKPDLNEAQEILEIKEEEPQPTEKKQEEAKPTNKFLGFMSTLYNAIKDTSLKAIDSVDKGFKQYKIDEKLQSIGNTLAGAIQTGGNYVSDKAQQAANSEFAQNMTKKTKEGVNVLVERTKTLMKNEGNKGPENEQNKGENLQEKKEENKEEPKQEEKKEEPKQEEKKEEKKEENNISENNVLIKDNNLPGSNPNPNPEEKVEPPQEQTSEQEQKTDPVPEGENQNAQS